MSAVATGGRVRIGRAPVDLCTMDEAVRRILAHAEAGGAPEFVVTPNAHHVVMLEDSSRFREVYERAWLSLADGMSVVWAARMLGTPVPEKVSGSDLFPRVCQAAGPDVRVFLLGGRPGRRTRPRVCCASATHPCGSWGRTARRWASSTTRRSWSERTRR